MRAHTSAFVGVAGAVLLCFLAIGAVLPVLPRYVAGPLEGGDVAVGAVAGAFALTAVVFRPIGGRWADRVGRRRVVTIGMLISSLAGALYLVPAGVPGLIAARMVLGIGDGWVYTAGVSWVVDVTPAERRGQVIGLFGLAVWGGLSIGPLIGSALLDLASYEAVWLFAAAAPLLAVALVRRVPDSPATARGGGGPSRLLAREALRPGIALLLATIGYAALAGFVVLHLDERDVGHGALVFASYAGAVVFARVALGALPDRFGPRRCAVGAGAAEAVGLVVIALAGSLPTALAGAFVTGVGAALIFPSLALLVVEQVGDERRGAAMGTFTAFFDLGVGIGAPLAGAIAALAGYPAAFAAAAVAAAAGSAVGIAGAAGRRPAVLAPMRRGEELPPAG